jgi:hypothetical protein
MVETKSMFLYLLLQLDFILIKNVPKTFSFFYFSCLIQNVNLRQRNASQTLSVMLALSKYKL